jgi:hypothetical protein
MGRPDTKQELEAKLARRAALVEEFRKCETAALIRDMEAELRQQIRDLEVQ